jgi:hypothetical protein
MDTPRLFFKPKTRAALNRLRSSGRWVREIQDQSTLRMTTMGSLLAPDFVTEGRSVILEGKPGRGKTHLAIAIAYRALQNGFDALFTTAAELIEHLSAASRDGAMHEALAAYLRPHVLVVDEVGYLACSDDAANVLYHVVNDRHIKRRAMVFTTNKHPKRWGRALHDDDLAEAIVDRILERGRLLRLDGPSGRTKHLSGDDLADEDPNDPSGSRVSGRTAAEFPERTSVRHEASLRAPRFQISIPAALRKPPEGGHTAHHPYGSCGLAALPDALLDDALLDRGLNPGDASQVGGSRSTSRPDGIPGDVRRPDRSNRAGDLLDAARPEVWCRSRAGPHVRCGSRHGHAGARITHREPLERGRIRATAKRSNMTA